MKAVLERVLEKGVGKGARGRNTTLEREQMFVCYGVGLGYPCVQMVIQRGPSTSRCNKLGIEFDSRGHTQHKRHAMQIVQTTEYILCGL